MREIKFRGKRTDNGEWVYGCTVKDKCASCWIYEVEDEYSHFAWITYAVDKKTVGQYTGVKDKNEVEVYEVDLIEIYFDFGTYRFKIEYLEDLFQFVAINIDCYDDIYSLESLSILDFEVIGNIHESVKDE